ncbi:MAG: type 1 glutamine amidotransferase domain-containing protein [Acidimicrobiales bacterium]
MATVLIPLPDRDFDPTEVAVSWRTLVGLGHRVRFATPGGEPSRGDDLMVTGRGLDPWGFVPGLSRLVVVGRVLRADARGRHAYEELLGAPEFRRPLAWEAIDLDGVGGVLLPGGHRARGMRPYLESELLQRVVVASFRRRLAVAAVCHGVLLAARSIDPDTGRSVLHGRRTTALTWSLERRAWRVARITRFWDPDYYRTYREGRGQPAGFLSVQQEVTRALARPEDFLDVDPTGPHARLRRSGRARDTPDDERPAFVVRDGDYLSARWPGDVHTLARRFASVLDGPETDGSPRRGEEAIPS